MADKLMTPKFPDVHVQLSGEDGNAFAILARVKRAMRKGGVPDEFIAEFREEAMSGDYDHLLQTVMDWVSTE